MTGQHSPERQGVGRRKEDESDCKIHEERLDAFDKGIASNHGWLKGASCLVAIVGFITTLFCTTIIARLGTITDLLTDYRVMLKQHETEISGLKSDVQEIKQRHNFLDQNGVIKKAR
jgi:hypothetical protein